MISTRTLAVVVLAFSSLLVTNRAQAATVSYNFTYSGTDTFSPTATSTASGSGSFTITYTTVGAQLPSALTAFSFSDTITETTPTSSSSVFTYTLSNVSDDAIVLGGTVASPTLASFMVTTSAVTGTNSGVGPVSFTMSYAGANPGTGSTSSQNVNLGYFTNGGVTITQAQTLAVPEPATLPMLGLALAFGTLLLRRRARFV